MLDSLYAQENERALDLAERFPSRPRAPEAGLGGQIAELGAAPFKGFGQAINQTVRAAYRSITAGADRRMAEQQADADFQVAGELFKRRLELDEERAAIDAGMRSAIDFYKPDPVTATTASQIVQGASRFLTKAVGYSVAVGPMAGAVLTGADEGMTGALELQDQGVDPATAAKAGAVRGVSAAVQVALPAFGTTALGTAGLALAGGAPTYIAENLAAREILKAADYSKQAEGFDPFDPVGLTVATIAPFAFGFGLRALSGKGKKASPTPEEVDAARATLAATEQQASALVSPADLAGAAAHTKALDEAAVQLMRGEPVTVADLVRMDEDGAAKLTDAAAKIEAELQAARAAEADAIADAAGRIDPIDTAAFTVDTFRASPDNLATLRGMAKTAGWDEQGGRLLRVDGENQLSDAAGRTQWIGPEWWGRMRRDMEASGLTRPDQIQRAVEKYAAGERLGARERRTVEWMIQELADNDRAARKAAALEGIDPDDFRSALRESGLGREESADAAIVARASEIDEAAVERAAVQYADDDAGFMAAVRQIIGSEDGQATNARAGAAEGGQGVQGQARQAGEARAQADPIALAVRDALAERPDLPAFVMEDADGNARTLTADEFLRQVQDDAAREAADADLVMVAANCHIGVG